MKRKWGKWILGGVLITAMLGLAPMAMAAQQVQVTLVDDAIGSTQGPPVTQEVSKVSCNDAAGIITQVDVSVTGLQMLTTLGVKNISDAPDLFAVEYIRHLTLLAEITAPDAISVNGTTPNNGGPFQYPLDAGECMPDSPCPPGSNPGPEDLGRINLWQTNGGTFSATYKPGDTNFDTFAGAGTFTFSLYATSQLNQTQAGSFRAYNETVAEVTVDVEAICGVPELVCNGKSFDINELPLDENEKASGLATATVSFTNTGDIDLTDVVITDELPMYMTYVSGSTTVNGSPGPDPAGTSTLTWSNVALDAGDTITVTYQVQITDMPADSQICNDAYASSAQYDLRTAQTCQDCITTPPPPKPPVVPAFNPLGLLLFAGLIPLSWVLVNRRKK